MNFQEDLTQPRNKKTKTSTQQIQFHLAGVYDQISKMIEENEDLQIQLPNDVPTGVQRINLIKSVVGYLLEELKSKAISQTMTKRKLQIDESQENLDIECKDCLNYEKNLQKVEGEVRNHIRTHQQLKIYQDSLQEKIEEHKKERKEHEKKVESLKKKYEEMKAIANTNSEKATKLELQNEKLRNEMKSGRHKENDKKMHRYESNKENFGEINHRANQKKERSSIERRPESTQRVRISVNARSSKGIPVTSKILHEKPRQDKTKAIKSRLGFGY